MAVLSLNGNTPQTGTGIPGNRVAADMVLWDQFGNQLGSSATPFIVQSLTDSLQGQGQSYVASSGRLNLTLAGNMRVTFQNPTGSGVTALITAVAVTVDGSAIINGMTSMQPSAGLPATAGLIKNTQFIAANNNNVSQSLIKADTNATAISGGTNMLPMVLYPGRTVYSQSKFSVSPGVMVGINLPFLGLGNGEVVFYYTEF